MKKIILASLIIASAGCTNYNVRTEALSGSEYSNAEQYCHSDRNGSLVWKNNVAYCDNGSRTYLVPKADYKENNPTIFH